MNQHLRFDSESVSNFADARSRELESYKSTSVEPHTKVSQDVDLPEISKHKKKHKRKRYDEQNDIVKTDYIDGNLITTFEQDFKARKQKKHTIDHQGVAPSVTKYVESMSDGEYENKQCDGFYQSFSKCVEDEPQLKKHKKKKKKITEYSDTEFSVLKTQQDLFNNENISMNVITSDDGLILAKHADHEENINDFQKKKKKHKNKSKHKEVLLNNGIADVSHAHISNRDNHSEKINDNNPFAKPKMKEDTTKKSEYLLSIDTLCKGNENVLLPDTDAAVSFHEISKKKKKHKKRKQTTDSETTECDKLIVEPTVNSNEIMRKKKKKHKKREHSVDSVSAECAKLIVEPAVNSNEIMRKKKKHKKREESYDLESIECAEFVSETTENNKSTLYESVTVDSMLSPKKNKSHKRKKASHTESKSEVILEKESSYGSTEHENDNFFQEETLPICQVLDNNLFDTSEPAEMQRKKGHKKRKEDLGTDLTDKSDQLYHQDIYPECEDTQPLAMVKLIPQTHDANINEGSTKQKHKKKKKSTSNKEGSEKDKVSVQEQRNVNEGKEGELMSCENIAGVLMSQGHMKNNKKKNGELLQNSILDVSDELENSQVLNTLHSVSVESSENFNAAVNQNKALSKKKKHKKKKKANLDLDVPPGCNELVQEHCGDQQNIDSLVNQSVLNEKHNKHEESCLSEVMDNDADSAKENDNSLSESSIEYNCSKYDLEEELPDFEIPPMHKIERVTPLTKEQKEEFQKQGIQIRSGKFSSEENDIIIRNWNEFVDCFKVNDPALLLGINRGGVNKNKVLKFLRAKHFYVRLAKDLNNRTLFSVYKRARAILDPSKCSDKFTPEEVNKLIYLHSLHGSKWSLIAKIMNKTAIQCQTSFRCHSKKPKKGLWTKVENDALLDAVSEVCGCDVNMLSLMRCGQSWEKVANKVKTRNSFQCREHYLNLMSWTTDVSEREKWSKKDKAFLIYVLYQNRVQDESLIDWESLYPMFQSRLPSYAALNHKWRKLKYKVPNYKRKTYTQVLTCLYNNYLPRVIKKYALAMPELSKMYEQKLNTKN